MQSIVSLVPSDDHMTRASAAGAWARRFGRRLAGHRAVLDRDVVGRRRRCGRHGRHVSRHLERPFAGHRRAVRHLAGKIRRGRAHRARDRAGSTFWANSCAMKPAPDISSAASCSIRRSAAPIVPIGHDELRIIFDAAGPNTINVGHLQQDTSIGAYVNVDDMVRKHFAIFGSTGAGKSSGVALILREIMEARPELRILLIDPHNEYAACFEDRAHVVRPGNLRLPFWLFNFDEIVEVIFGRRSDVEEEIALLAELIPLAKNDYARTAAAGRGSYRAVRARRRQLHGRHARSLSHGRPRRDGREPDGQAREQRRRDPLQAPAHAPAFGAQEPALRLHLRRAERRQRHHGRDPVRAAAAAARRPADDDHAARRFPRRGVRRDRLRHVPPRLRVRPVERRRAAAAHRLRGGAQLRQCRPQHRLPPGARSGLAHRQGRAQIRRVSRPGDATPGAARSDA